MFGFEKFLKKIIEENYYPDFNMIIGSATLPEVDIGGRKLLMFSSNNYLGIANNPEIIKSASAALNRYGLGSGGSRLLSGNIDIHNELEKTIADFKNQESAIVFLAGYMANVGAIPAIVNHYTISSKLIFIKKIERYNDSAIFSDELNHASIVDGVRLSKAERLVYKHNDMEDLENLLKKCKNKGRLIVTDGVFSMDGDIAPVDKLVRLAKQYDALLMVDDAHASGVLGKNGRGTGEYFNVEDKIDIVMGTFTKAFGGIGGFISGSKELTDYLRISARTYVFSAPPPPVISAGLIKSIKIVKESNYLREKLWSNVNYLRAGLKDLGFTVLGETQILPVLIGDEDKAIKISRKLFENGIFAPAVRWPAVSKGNSRLRLTVMASHTKEHIIKLLEVLGKLI